MQRFRLLALLLSALSPLASAQERPDPAVLIEQARGLLPRYEGDAIEFLTSEQRRDVQAADHLFQAGMALQGETAYSLWWGGHARVLLAEDARNRGDQRTASRYDRGALAFFDRAIDLDPSYHWAFYARANARRSSGALFAALDDFSEAVRLANAVIERVDSNSAQDALLVRFKARQWGADTRMRVFEFDEARSEFRTFYAENGNNAWDLAYSLAESHQRERDFAGAIGIYEGVLENEEFQAFDSTYSQLAYLAGLTGNTAGAMRRLDQTFERERSPTLYPRLWIWLLARGPEWSEKRVAARKELEEFLAAPPSSFPAWDAALGAFMLGTLEESAFLETAQAEYERRTNEAVALDGLMCEVAFYRGVRAEMDAEAHPGSSANSLSQALAAYGEALAFDPVAFKWEWAYARLGYRRVAAALGHTRASGFLVRGARFDPSQDFRPVRRHRAGEAQSEPVSEIDGTGFAPGDLLQGYLLDSNGERRAVRVLCAAP